MADNITVTQGTGKTIAADEISSVLHQRVKVQYGVDGSATDVSSSAPLPVTGTVELGTNDNAVLDDIAANQTDNSQKTQIVDASGNAVTVTGNKLDVNATASLSGESIPVSGATTGVAVAIVDGSGNQITSFGGGTQYTEGDTDATITGTAALVEGAANALNVMTQPLTDTQLRAADVKVTLDGESVPVTGTFWQATQPISGTVTANLSSTDNDVLDAIESDTTTIAGAVSGTEMQVDIVSAPTLTVNSHAVTNAGTFAVQVDGSALTSLQLIDDTVATDGSATPTKGILFAGQDGTNAQTIKTDSSGELQVDVLTMPTTTVTATDLDIRPLVNTDVVTAELSAVDNAVLDTIAAKDFATQTTLAAINAKMVSGTDIGDVTINNASGASAVNIQDGGNTITVDGTVAVTNSDITSIKTAVEIIDNAISGSEMQVDVVGALPAGTNAIGKLAANSGVDIGDVDVTSISAGTNLIGDVGIQPRTTNGLDTFMASGSDGSSILVATAQAVKASAGKVYGYYLYNPESAVTFVHFYNTAAASVTVGTTSPLFTLAIPAGSAANLGITDMGVTFGTAISVSATTTAGGNTAPTTGISAVIWFK